MTAERWARAVRHQLGLGRLLPLGGARDGAWITEQAAGAVLGRAARETRGLRLGPVRIGLADPADVREPAVPPPPGALPPGPLRVTAEFAATASEPLPVTAARLRALVVTAAQGLGLEVAEVDLRVTDLLDEEPEPPAREPRPDPVRPSEPAPAAPSGGDDDAVRAAEAALGVPGVDRLTDVLGRPAHITERQDDTAALPRRHVRVELAVGTGHRALDVARKVRAAVERALPGHPTVAVLVTAVG
ncbi:nucleopolyhedrovirus P10 family protein [Streptomyces sp. YU58]|uniref:nucleopolyhedrovirus P10 family protein n=1 Tax=Streptomyces sp. SX92 TaxID=3158972 RepID=UPI0027BAE041|nr:nucleopolyhedrovirus P10 family protein [Streptomyces coralus]WLW56066.1 nucleopolyhedrovirus P10 family protein [Streptomyces coralus]